MTLAPTRTASALTLVGMVCVLGIAISAHLNPLSAVDSDVLHWGLHHRSTGVTSVATAIADLFAPVWVGIWTLVAAGVLMLRDRNASTAIALISTVAAAGVICEVLKLGVDRLRPPPVDQLIPPEVSMSFPSGHVTGTAAFAIGLAIVATSSAHAALRKSAFGVAVVLTVVVSMTRLYLGVHWFSDVAAAVAVATAAAIVVPVLTGVAIAHLTPRLPDRLQHYVQPQTMTATKG